jgi:hypothetical protein
MASEITGEQATAVAEPRFTSFRAFWPHYVRAHRRPVTRALHFAGFTLAMVVVASALLTGRPWLLVGAPLVGYGLSWVGHFCFERNTPATFRHPLYSLLGDCVMYGKILSGSMRAEVERATD